MRFDRHQGKVIPYGSFNPSVDPITPGAVLGTINAIPTVAGYRSLPGPKPMALALPARPNGSTFTTYSTGETRIIAGTQAHLYERQPNFTWKEIDGGQTFVATGRWRFARFADDLIAVADNVAPQVATGPFGVFGPLGGGPPFGATLVTAVAGFVLMAKGTEWFCSAAGADNSWTPDIQTLANSAVLYDAPGPIVAIANILRTAILFKNRAMWLGREVGAPSTFSMDVLSTATGTWCQEAVIVGPDVLAFVGSDDFYICSGYTPQPIPNSPKTWFFRKVSLDDNGQPNRMTEITSRFDYLNSVFWWYFPTQHAAPGTTDHYIAYNFRANRWAEGPLSITYALGASGA